MPFADRDGTAEPVRETQTEALPLGVPLERALPLLAREAEGPAEGVFVAASEAEARPLPKEETTPPVIKIKRLSEFLCGILNKLTISQS